MDLNFDNVKSTNLYDEINSDCGYDLYWCYVGILVTNKKHANMYIGDLVTLHEPYYNNFALECFSPTQIIYHLTIESNDIFNVLDDSSTQKENDEHIKLAHLQKMEYRNDTIFCHFTKEFYTQEGWQNVNCYNKYIKIDNLPF